MMKYEKDKKNGQAENHEYSIVSRQTKDSNKKHGNKQNA